MPGRTTITLLVLLALAAGFLLAAIAVFARGDDLMALMLAAMGGVSLRALSRALSVAEAGR